MPLNVDTTRALRTVPELVSLVEAIRDALATEPETDFVEWKTAWDFGAAEIRFQTARHILGFGNRAVAGAAQQFEGCAYFVAGVEPQNLAGTTAVDSADLTNYIGGYVLNGEPRWTPHYVTVDGHSVLIVAIEAPRPGDHIFTLKKGYGRALAGTIFVRRHGKTEQANPSEVRALEARLGSARPRVELSVTRADDGDLRTGRFTKRDDWLAAERERLLEPFEKQLATGNTHRDVSVGSHVVQTTDPYDGRGAQGFREEVDEYLEKKAPERWFAMVVARSITRGLAPLRLQIVNPTERNFEAVEVSLTIPGGALPYPSLEEARVHFAPPDPPNPWGQGRNYRELAADLLNAASGGTTTPGPFTSFIQRDESGARVRFPSTHIRPGDPVALPPIHLVLPSKLAGRSLSVGWRVTSTSADAWQEGRILYDIDSEPVDIDLPHPSK